MNEEAIRFNVDGVTRFAPKFGSGPVKTVVLHGYMQSVNSCAELGETMASRPDESAIVIPTPDLGSEPPLGRPASIAALVDYLNKAMKALNIPPGVCVTGVSFGGSLAVLLAAFRPDLVSSVVLINPKLTPTTGVTAVADMYSYMELAGHPEAAKRATTDAAASFMPLNAFGPAGAWIESIQKFAAVSQLGLIASEVDTGGCIDRLKFLRAPVTLIVGRYDLSTPAGVSIAYVSQLEPVDRAALQSNGVYRGDRVTVHVLNNGHFIGAFMTDPLRNALSQHQLQWASGGQPPLCTTCPQLDNLLAEFPLQFAPSGNALVASQPDSNFVLTR